MLCDTDRKIGLEYDACDSVDAGYAKRITYVIGVDGRVEQAIEKVSAAEHPASLLETL